MDQYVPLKDGEIRLLMLKAGKEPEPIAGSLLVVALADKPHFEALSYTWGDPCHLQSMSLSGQPVEIRSNLHSALFHLRTENKRALWIDALCINQLDVEERNSQVMLMGQIYRSALTVVAWLGPGTYESDVAIEYINSKNAYCADLPKDDPFVKCIWSLQGREYWRRQWVVQEFCLAESLTVMCGSKYADWDNFQHTAYCQPDESLRQYKWCLFNLVTLRKLKISEAYDVTLQNFMHFSRACLCSDPRDKIYSLLGLVDNNATMDAARSVNEGKEKTPWKIEVDYEKEVWEVYRDVMCKFRHENLKPTGASFLQWSWMAQEALTSRGAKNIGVRIPDLSFQTQSDRKESGPLHAEAFKIQLLFLGRIAIAGPEKGYVNSIQETSERQTEHFWGVVRRMGGNEISEVQDFSQNTRGREGEFNFNNGEGKRKFRFNTRSVGLGAVTMQRIVPLEMHHGTGEALSGRIFTDVSSTNSSLDSFGSLSPDVVSSEKIAAAHKVERREVEENAKELEQEEKEGCRVYFFAREDGLTGLMPPNARVGDLIYQLDSGGYVESYMCVFCSINDLRSTK